MSQMTEEKLELRNSISLFLFFAVLSGAMGVLGFPVATLFTLPVFLWSIYSLVLRRRCAWLEGDMVEVRSMHVWSRAASFPLAVLDDATLAEIDSKEDSPSKRTVLRFTLNEGKEIQELRRSKMQDESFTIYSRTLQIVITSDKAAAEQFVEALRRKVDGTEDATVGK